MPSYNEKLRNCEDYDLIARITGVPTPRRLQDGGQVQAVDRFLSKVA